MLDESLVIIISKAVNNFFIKVNASYVHNLLYVKEANLHYVCLLINKHNN